MRTGNLRFFSTILYTTLRDRKSFERETSASLGGWAGGEVGLARVIIDEFFIPLSDAITS